MSKRVEINAEQAEKLLNKKPTAKGKKRRDEIQEDAEFEGKMSEHVAKQPRKKAEVEVDSKVNAGDIRGVMTETIARVYEEIWPGINVRNGGTETPDQDMAEEAYILGLTMVVGNTVELPRQPLKIRDAEISDGAIYCQEHAA